MHILLVGGTTDLAQRLTLSAGPGISVLQLNGWHEAVRYLVNGCAIGGILICAEHIEHRAAVVEAIRARGFSVPTAVYLSQATLRLVQSAWSLARLGVDLLIEGPELATQLRKFIKDENRLIIDKLAVHYHIRTPEARRLLSLLGSEKEAVHASADDLASRLKTTRSTLYGVVNAAGLPGVEQLQFLFRLLPAITMIQSGGRVDDAAHVARIADARTFRRTLRTRFDVSIEDLRVHRELEWALGRWVQIHPPKTRVRRLATHAGR